MKNLSIIACISQDFGLGNANQLLWRSSQDMQFFRLTTTGHAVIMGSKTFQSIGRALPNRENIILTRQEITDPTVKVFHDEASLNQYIEAIPDEKFIIGGASLYKMYIDLAEKLYLTEVNASKPADTFFPEFDRSQFSRKVLQTFSEDGVSFEIVEYTRKS